nr:hypothetical protein [Lysinibacillus timonensis]
MDEEKLERLLVEAKEKIPVDNEFKKSLRKSFEKNSKTRWNSTMKALFGLTAAAIVAITFILTSTQQRIVSAAELLITNALSFVDMAQGNITALDYQDGQLFISIKGEGTFRYTSNGLVKVSDLEADAISVNKDGSKMLLSNEGDIYVLDLVKHEQRNLLKGSNQKQWTMPVWKDEQVYYVVKHIDGEKQIVLKSLYDTNEELIATNSNSTIAVTKDFIVYEENGNIVKKDLVSGESIFVDSGKNPSVSKDGHYITYVKEENGLEDVWIIDANLKTKKKITSNLKQYNSSLQMYQYGHHVWDSKENTLYLIKKRMNGMNVEDIRLAKIELGTQELSSVETLEQFLQALILRDDDYAKSLMNQPPEFLTVSNPRYKGFKILSNTKEKDLEHVQVEVTLAEGHLPYNSIVKLDFQLKKVEGGYQIESYTEVGKTEILSSDMEYVQLIEGELKRDLFSLDDLRDRPEILDSNIRFSSMVYNPGEEILFFGVQEMPLNEESSSVTLWTYDLNEHEFAFLQRIDGGIVLESITLSPNNKYLAVDIFSEKDDEPSLYIVDIEENEYSIILNQSTSTFWKDDSLYYELCEGKQTTIQEFNLQHSNSSNSD